jgi:hypothetical protein
MINIGTHQPILLDVVKRTNKPILELGAGNESTKQIHKITNNPIVTIEDSKFWLRRFLHLQSTRHQFLLMNTRQMREYFLVDTTEWGVVFVDSTDWEQRMLAINKYKDTADYVVIHDVEMTSACKGYFGEDHRGKRTFDKWFKYWVEYEHQELAAPTTLLASNKIDLKDMQIAEVVKINQNK